MISISYLFIITLEQLITQVHITMNHHKIHMSAQLLSTNYILFTYSIHQQLLPSYSSLYSILFNPLNIPYSHICISNDYAPPPIRKPTDTHHGRGHVHAVLCPIHPHPRRIVQRRIISQGQLLWNGRHGTSYRLNHLPGLIP